MKFNLNKKKFKTVSSSSNGDVSSETLFEYHQNGPIIWATYQGGTILFGALSGCIERNRLLFTYHHQNLEGEFKTGKCESILTLKDSKLILNEKWQWTCGDYSKGTSLLKEL